jgi:hypothetical protein
LTEIDKEKLELILGHPDYEALTPKQQRFLRAYLETAGDKRAAFQASGFNAKTDNSREAFTARLLKIPNIRSLIQEYFGFGDLKSQLQKDELLGILSKEIRRAHDKSVSLVYFIPLLRLYTEIKGWVAAPKPTWTAAKQRKNVTKAQKDTKKAAEKTTASLLDIVHQIEGNNEQFS